MKHYLGLSAVLVFMSSCGARVVAMPPDAIEQAVTEAGVNSSTEGVAAPAPGAPPVEAQAPEVADSVDPTAMPAEAPSTEPTYSPGEVAAQLPKAEQAGPASVLIEAPEGSTATYRLDNEAPIETGLSFSIDGIDPGAHTLEIEVTLPDGQKKSFDAQWQQLDENDAVFREVEGADTGIESVGIPTFPEPKRKKDPPAKSQGAEHADESSAHHR